MSADIPKEDFLYDLVKSDRGDGILRDNTIANRSKEIEEDRGTQIEGYACYRKEKRDEMVGNQMVDKRNMGLITCPGAMINQMFAETRVQTTSEDAQADEGEIELTVTCSWGCNYVLYYPVHANMYEIKLDISKLMDTNQDHIMLTLQNGGTLGDWLPLAAIVPPGQTFFAISVKLLPFFGSDSLEEYKACNQYFDQVKPLEQTRLVEIETINGSLLKVPVIIISLNYCKEWLGGFRNPVTGQAYHHATTNTDWWTRRWLTGDKISRQCQTANLNDKYIQPKRDCRTQTFRDCIFQDPFMDRIIMPSNTYVDSSSIEEVEQAKLNRSVRIIQNTFRHYCGRKKARDIFISIIKGCRSLGAQKKTELDSFFQAAEIKRVIGTMFPKTRIDFFYLYVYISLWWKKEYEIINTMMDVAERKGEYMKLLEDEIKWLSRLEEKKIKAKTASLTKRDLNVVNEGSRPTILKTMQSMSLIERQDILMARELKEIYASLQRSCSNAQDRMEGLLKLAIRARQYEDCENLASLFEREIDLLAIGLKDRDLQGLRLRIDQEFIALMKTRSWNPSGSFYRPFTYPRMKARTFKCPACGHLKNIVQFDLHVRLRHLSRCQSCLWLQQMSKNKVNLGPYKHILDCLRGKEIELEDSSIMCFFMQPFGAHFLVNIMWNGRSAISEANDPDRLRLTRWRRREPWSPWNSILLTDEECYYHDCLDCPEQAYEKEFIDIIDLRLKLIGSIFLSLKDIDTMAKNCGVFEVNTQVGSSINYKVKQETIQPINPFYKRPPTKKNPLWLAASGGYQFSPSYRLAC